MHRQHLIHIFIYDILSNDHSHVDKYFTHVNTKEYMVSSLWWLPMLIWNLWAVIFMFQGFSYMYFPKTWEMIKKKKKPRNIKPELWPCKWNHLTFHLYSMLQTYYLILLLYIHRLMHYNFNKLLSIIKSISMCFNVSLFLLDSFYLFLFNWKIIAL